MRYRHLILVAAVQVLAATSKASTGLAQAPAGAAKHDPEIHWGPAPAVFPPGAEFAVMAGDPSKAEEFTVRLRLPDGYKIPPHTHPTTENVTVLSGTFLAGMGGQFVESKLQPFSAGGFASIPATMAHYAMARGKTVVQVHGIGPFSLTYVNAADAPKPR